MIFAFLRIVRERWKICIDKFCKKIILELLYQVQNFRSSKKSQADTWNIDLSTKVLPRARKKAISIMMAMYPSRILKWLLTVGWPSERAVERASSHQKTSTKQNKSYSWQQFAKVAINVLTESQAALLLFLKPCQASLPFLPHHLSN